MKIFYEHKMINSESEKNPEKLTEFNLEKIPNNILEIIKNNTAFQRSGTLGNKKLGSPIEYEKLVIVDDQSKYEIEYFNKGISYMMMKNSEAERQVFQVFAYFMKEVRT